MPRDPKLSAAVAMLKVAGHPLRARILLALDEGPRDGKALMEVSGCGQARLSGVLTPLRLVGLVETTQAGQRRVHALTPAGRTLAEALQKLSG
jgi:DNA-binding HxlR family transcriptional regulator